MPSQRPSKGRKKKKAKLEGKNESLDKLMQALELPDDWDLLLVGDGSGHTWQMHCGWGCVSVRRKDMSREVWHGAMNYGSVNLAELMAYMQPMSWFYRELCEAGQWNKLYKVQILTDSTYVVNQLSDRCHTRSLAGELLYSLKHRGVLCQASYIPRDSIGLNMVADILSKESRKTLQASPIAEETTSSRFEGCDSIYAVNPFD